MVDPFAVKSGSLSGFVFEPFEVVKKELSVWTFLSLNSLLLAKSMLTPSEAAINERFKNLALIPRRYELTRNVMLYAHMASPLAWVVDRWFPLLKYSSFDLETFQVDP